MTTTNHDADMCGSYYGARTTPWPPATVTAGDGNYLIGMGRNGADQGYLYNLFLRWDTSALPDADVVTGAELEVYVPTTPTFDSASNGVNAEWFDLSGGAGVLSASWSNTAGTSALNDVATGGTGTGWRTYTLAGADTGVNKTGYTGLRCMGTDHGDYALNENNLLAISDEASANKPILRVFHTTPSGVQKMTMFFAT